MKRKGDGDSIQVKAREGVLGTSWPDPRPPAPPDLRAQTR